MKPFAASLPASARCSLFGAALAVFSLVSAQPAGAQLVSAAAQTFDIPSQEASSALVQFCLQAD
ncbi:MAG TPA: hypothetical protein PLH31_18095, partial [Caulobacter sp.]|nr:hypothetical protein [Caulobacter sp.]